MKQWTLTGFEKYGKTTRRAHFLADINKIIPWPELAAAVQTAYPKVSEHGGRAPIPMERMLRIYFLQSWFNLSDPAVEEALYDSVSMRSFVGIDLGVEGARSSTKNQDGKRDPEMHQTAKGQQWYFGMKAHIGVDSRTKLVHTVLVSAANVHDREALPHLLHGNETRAWGDQGYQGQTAVIHQVAPNAKHFTNRRYRFNGRTNEVEKAKNRYKSRGPKSRTCSA